MTHLRILAGIALFGAAVLYGALLHLLGASSSRSRSAVARVMAGPICRITRLRVRLTHPERLESAGPCVVIGNQQSVLCYCIYARLFLRVPNSGVVAKMVGKWDLPVAAWLFRKTGNFMVDPGNPVRTAVGYMGALKALQEEGTRVWIGPEGTRGREPGALGRFRPGAFRLAVKGGVPIVPLVISPLKPRTDLEARRLEPNEVELRVLDPIPTEGLTLEELPALRDLARRRMQEALDEMSAARGLRSSPPRDGGSGSPPPASAPPPTPAPPGRGS